MGKINVQRLGYVDNVNASSADVNFIANFTKKVLRSDVFFPIGGVNDVQQLQLDQTGDDLDTVSLRQPMSKSSVVK